MNRPARSPASRVLPVLALCALAAASATSLDVLLRGDTASQGTSVELEVLGDPAGDAGQIELIAKPEKRIPGTGNDSTVLTVEVRTAGTTTVIFSGSVVTGSGGTYSGLVLTGVSAGTYDLAAKGYSHLRRTISSVAISSGVTVDFTSAGASPLFSGDVNAADGDNKVNGIDLTLIVNALFGHVVRYDLNRDGLVNGIDLTNAVTNLNDLGDA